MEEEFFEDTVDGIPQSPRSPAQSSYGGSDAGDADADREVENLDELDENDSSREKFMHDSPEEQSDEQENRGNGTEDSNNIQTDESTTTSKAVEALVPANQATATGEKRYKYKYPEAYPTPPGWDDEVWNKAYTAADSRIYNHAKKNHMVSKQKRAEGVTRTEALDWEKNKPAREAKRASKKNVSAPKQQSLRAEAGSSKSTASGTSKLLDPDASRKVQKKKAKATTPVGNNSFQQTSHFMVPEEPYQFAPAAQQTLADRIKGKSAASAAANFALSNDIGTPIRSESEKAQQSKKGSDSNLPVKKSAYATKGEVHPPLVRAPMAPKFTAPKARTSSKSGTPASALNVTQDYSDLEQFTDAEGEDDGTNTLFCICRMTASTYMIACDNCGEWCHRRADCLGKEDPAIYKVHEHNIDKWYCPTCRAKNPAMKITFYRVCRNEGCDKPALVNAAKPSKYCGKACAVEFATGYLAKAPKGENPSKGGALTQSEIINLLGSVSSAAEFQSLGKAAPKLQVEGEAASKQFLSNLVVGDNRKGKENSGMAYESKADDKEKTAVNEYPNGEEIKEENTEEEWARQLASIREVYNQKPYYPNGRRPSNEEFVELIYLALGRSETFTAENYLNIDWSFLQRHGMCNPSEAEAIHDHQEMIKYDQLWIKNASLRLSFNKVVKEHSATILKAQDLDPKTHCGYLPIISKSENDFRIYSETPEGAHVCKVGRLEHVNPDLDADFQEELAASICSQNIKKQRHTTHFLWAETHEKEIIGRRIHLTQDMRKQLVALNEIMSIIHQRILEPDWRPIL